MNYDLYRLLQKKKRSKPMRHRFMSQSLIYSNNNSRSFRKKPSSHKNLFKKKLEPKIPKSKPESSFIPKIQTLAQNLELEFSVPRNPNAKKEFSFENSKSKEMIIADNFSFSEKLHGKLTSDKLEDSRKNGQSNVQASSQKSSSGVFGSICSSIMNRYNSFIQVIS